MTHLACSSAKPWDLPGALCFMWPSTVDTPNLTGMERSPTSDRSRPTTPHQLEWSPLSALVGSCFSESVTPEDAELDCFVLRD